MEQALRGEAFNFRTMDFQEAVDRKSYFRTVNPKTVLKS